ncbi:MAG: T9SS type A sorting domain-containing protein [Bacteroidota bacterium]
MKYIRIIFFLLISSVTSAQSVTKRVLFLGNSYTYVNDLPATIANVAFSMSDSLIYDSYTPGGYSIGNHSLDPNSLAKIMTGNWDYVVLQGQSYEFVTTDPFTFSPAPYVHKLDSLIKVYNSCSETILYMTWARKNGDPGSCPNYPWLCNYHLMDSVIHLNYMLVADSNNAVVSPAGGVWNYIRQQFPNIELYQADESHPSEAGTYAAACCFYTTIFRKNPALISFNSTLSTADAFSIKSAAKIIVYDNLLNWHIGENDSILYINCPSGIDDGITIPPLTISPNPATSFIKVNFPGNNSALHISIYSLTGTLIKEADTFYNTWFPVSDLQGGMYFIRLNNEKEQTFKIVRY